MGAGATESMLTRTISSESKHDVLPMR